MTLCEAMAASSIGVFVVVSTLLVCMGMEIMLYPVRW